MPKKSFSREEDIIIVNTMRELHQQHGIFARLSRILPQHSVKQIYSRWENYLDPKLSHDDLSGEEKGFIDQWILRNRGTDGIIKWKNLRSDMKDIFGHLHSENKVKNYWYSKQRKLNRKQKEEIEYEDHSSSKGVFGGMEVSKECVHDMLRP